MKKFVIGIDGSGAAEALAEIQAYRKRIDEKTKEFVNRLAEIGLNVAKAMYSTAQYDGTNDLTVNIEQRGNSSVAIVAVGTTTWFLEFGSGYMLGYGHPEAGQHGMGPGTYPGKGHWNDPNGWYLPKSVQEEIGKKKSYGNPPTGAMYGARKEIEFQVEQIAREVFGA